MTNPPPDAGMPRWVKMLLLAGVVLVLLVVAGLLIVGGEHGPSRHMRPGDSAPTTIAIGDLTPLEDSHR